MQLRTFPFLLLSMAWYNFPGRIPTRSTDPLNLRIEVLPSPGTVNSGLVKGVVLELNQAWKE